MSIVSDILDVIKTRLQAVTVANGYENEVSGVELPSKFGGFKIDHFRVVVRSGDPTPKPELSSPGNPPRVALVLPVLVSGLVMPSDRDNQSIDQAVHDFGAELQNAITAPSNWHQFDGNAINVDSEDGGIGPVIHKQVDDTTSAAEFIIRVIYRVSETDQNELRG